MTLVLRRFYAEHRRLLLTMLAVLIGNVVFELAVGNPLDRVVTDAEERLSTARQQADEALLERGRAGLESMLLESARARIAQLNDETLRTNADRFPLVDARIKAIASSFGLEPKSIRYTYTWLSLEELEQLAVGLTLKGSYDDLREFVSQIEQARDDSGNDLFFAIEEVSLQDSTDRGSELNLNLQVTTYFHDPERAAAERELRIQRRSRRTRGSGR